MGNRNSRQMDDLLEERLGHRLGNMIDLLSYHIEDIVFASFDNDRTHSAESRAFVLKMSYC